MYLTRAGVFWVTVIICCICSIILFRRNTFAIGNTYKVQYIIKEPKVLKISRFLSKGETDALVKKISTKSQITNNDPIILNIKKRASHVVKIPVENIEPFQAVTKRTCVNSVSSTEHFSPVKPYGMTAYLDSGDVVVWQKY